MCHGLLVSPPLLLGELAGALVKKAGNAISAADREPGNHMHEQCGEIGHLVHAGWGAETADGLAPW